MPQQGGEEDSILAIAREISLRLETGLSREALMAIMDLLRQDVHPDAIVAVIESLTSSS